MCHATNKHEVVTEKNLRLGLWIYTTSMFFRNVDCISKGFSITTAVRTSKSIFKPAAQVTLYFQFPIKLNTSRNKIFLGTELQWRGYISLKQTIHSHNIATNRVATGSVGQRAPTIWMTFTVIGQHTLTQSRTFSGSAVWYYCEFCTKIGDYTQKHLQNYRHSLHLCSAAVFCTVKCGQWAFVTHKNIHECKRWRAVIICNWIRSQDHSWPITTFSYWSLLNWVNVYSVWNMKTRLHGLK
jgi:hypothetical protein